MPARIGDSSSRRCADRPAARPEPGDPRRIEPDGTAGWTGLRSPRRPAGSVQCGCGGMVDARVSNTLSARSVGSSPTTRTTSPMWNGCHCRMKRQEGPDCRDLRGRKGPFGRGMGDGFRLAVPTDYRPILGKREIARGLGALWEVFRRRTGILAETPTPFRRGMRPRMPASLCPAPVLDAAVGNWDDRRSR